MNCPRSYDWASSGLRISISIPTLPGAAGSPVSSNSTWNSELHFFKPVIVVSSWQCNHAAAQSTDAGVGLKTPCPRAPFPHAATLSHPPISETALTHTFPPVPRLLLLWFHRFLSPWQLESFFLFNASLVELLGCLKHASHFLVLTVAILCSSYLSHCISLLQTPAKLFLQIC